MAAGYFTHKNMSKLYGNAVAILNVQTFLPFTFCSVIMFTSSEILGKILFAVQVLRKRNCVNLGGKLPLITKGLIAFLGVRQIP